MNVDYKQARDVMFALVYNEWKAASTAIFGAEKPMLYQGVVQTSPPAADEYWARLSLVTGRQEQSNLGKCSNEAGSEGRRHTAVGALFVQMFFPLSGTGAWDNGLALAKRVKNVLAGASSSGTVWLRSPRIKELDPDGSHHRLNVVAEFEYDEVIV